MPTREERQQATHQMTRCDCGNIARFNQTQCSRCYEAERAHSEREADREYKLWVLDNCQDLGDLKAFIRDHILT